MRPSEFKKNGAGGAVLPKRRAWITNGHQKSSTVSVFFFVSVLHNIYQNTFQVQSIYKGVLVPQSPTIFIDS